MTLTERHMDAGDERVLLSPPKPVDETPTQSRRYRTSSGRRADQEILLDTATLTQALCHVRQWVDGRDILVVTTPTVKNIYGCLLKELVSTQGRRLLVLDCTESSKELAQVERVCRKARELHIDRKGILVGIGGGVCTDITTMAASLIRRGLHHFRVPTTLVGQIDAGIGYKGAVNFGGYKSFIGCFHPPTKVLIAPKFLSTLPAYHLREGFAEIIKMGIVRDPYLLRLVEHHASDLIRVAFDSYQTQGSEIIWRAIVSMMDELAKNPYEDQTYERLVDFGHTFSPLLESTSAHSLSHGNAVSVDMAITVSIATELGALDELYRDRVLALLSTLKLPIYSDFVSVDLCKDSLAAAARHRGGCPNLVLPTANGECQFLRSTNAVKGVVFEKVITMLQERQRLMID